MIFESIQYSATNSQTKIIIEINWSIWESNLLISILLSTLLIAMKFTIELRIFYRLERIAKSIRKNAFPNRLLFQKFYEKIGIYPIQWGYFRLIILLMFSLILFGSLLTLPILSMILFILAFIPLLSMNNVLRIIRPHSALGMKPLDVYKALMGFAAILWFFLPTNFSHPST